MLFKKMLLDRLLVFSDGLCTVLLSGTNQAAVPETDTVVLHFSIQAVAVRAVHVNSCVYLSEAQSLQYFKGQCSS